MISVVHSAHAWTRSDFARQQLPTLALQVGVAPPLAYGPPGSRAGSDETFSTSAHARTHTRNHHDLTSYASSFYSQPGVAEQVTGVQQLVVVLPSGNVLT